MLKAGVEAVSCFVVESEMDSIWRRVEIVLLKSKVNMIRIFGVGNGLHFQVCREVCGFERGVVCECKTLDLYIE